MGKKQVLSLVMIWICLMSISNISFANAQNQHLNEENGKEIGLIAGELAAQRDYINDHPKDWLKAYAEEEVRTISLYELDDQSYLTKYYFLRGFRKGFEEGYENGYRVLENQETTVTETNQKYRYAVSHGEFFGSLLGGQNGIKEYHGGKTNDWRRSVPSNTQLIREYSLNRDTEHYSNEFILSFKKAYQAAYTEAFRHANAENHRVTKEMGYIHGEEAGEEQGKVSGRIDFVDGRNSSWRAALPTDTEIIIQGNLMRGNSQYREGFIAGYKEGFKSGYTEFFQENNLSAILDNIKVTEVSMLGETISSTDEVLTVEIMPGAFYWETFFSVEKDTLPIYYLNTKRLEAATRKYSLEVENHLGAIELREPVTLSFTYYGTERAGIYQMINGEWRYLFSRIDGNTITTLIPKGVFSGGEYAVLIDQQYPELRDIYTHWASDEIYTFVRRFYVAGYPDRTFKPLENVSRGEFVTLLGRVLNWAPASKKVKEFKDVHEFGVFKSAILSAVDEGYIKGYPDETFKPKNPITYQEIEWIIQRVPGNNEFSWKEIQDSMMYEKYTRSDSRLSMKKNITRGEIIYMLYLLQEAGKL
ncbi:S-layer homology domain-containing protein [Alkaliphilus hydrothermalis]|uniref:Flagellar biosynthesis/type III secretory pathway protein FliH n=1 Tax=Alkaliphilus hydrothermalis TaxID=1482730 RepID=A0ABS2NN34_9FIRM|nr:S-layer homology domain-containing protein [Alkaliphilus hydrothermalis]MBM7613989.1 flagellar biosynthesis/type III secretory pathway protein FliH [Alkaliphilus hydrothermalis]